MRKKIFLITFVLMLITFTLSVYASEAAPSTNGYDFDIVYSGDVVEGEPKNATVILEAKDAKVYSKVRVDSKQLSGPSEDVKVIAYDEEGRGFDISESGDWGPQEGFQVGGTFRNETPITITYPKAGKYVTQLSLIDLENDNTVIVSEQFTINVLEAPTINNNVTNNTVTEIPQTGISIWTYAVIIILAIVLIYGVSKVIKK